MKPLKKNNRISRKGPVVLVIMDGVGIGDGGEGDAFALARTPMLDSLRKNYMYTQIRAHGTFVGLPDDSDMGNSEVGHNALGAGRVFDQGAKLVARAIESGDIFDSPAWKEVTAKPLSGGSALHFIGLLSDGNVHSHINHLFRLIEQAASEKIQNVRIHILLDGRDVPETSALIYIEQLENFLAGFKGQGLDYAIASGGGRMVTTMDRYEADWDIVRRGWDAHVRGNARPFGSAREAVETFRSEDPAITDQYLPSFTITRDSQPLGPVRDGDSVVFFNFRGDRAIEITRAFEEDNFNSFNRGKHPDVVYAGMMQYDGDLLIPKKYLVQPPAIDNTISEYLAFSGYRQYAISETQKFGHVTYFWNGNRSGKFNDDLEIYEEIQSDRIEFNQRPWMKAAEITDRTIEAIEGLEYDFIRLNYPNGDMVGHTGDREASIIAAEVLDICLKRLLKSVEKSGGIAVITADHGNLDDMFEKDKKSGNIIRDPETGLPKSKTSHSLNPVPVILYDPGFKNEYRLAEKDTPFGLSNIAATLLMLLSLDPPEGYDPPLIEYT